MPSKPRETPIERIFRKVIGRKMTPAIRALLLRISTTESSEDPTLLDYPGTMSQWDQESRVAEARLARGEIEGRGPAVSRRIPLFRDVSEHSC
jgi:hypothetical protein